jgi:hypothetical protein
MNFRSALRSFLLRWRLGLLLTGIFRAVLVAGVALLALGVFDFYAGLSDSARHVAFAVFATMAVFGAVWALWDAITFMRRDAARAADASIASGRRDVLSALELNADASGETPLGRWLCERSVEAAAAHLGALPLSGSVPLRAMGRRAGQALVVAAVFGALAITVPAAFKTIGLRLLDPDADLPPYSALHFTLGPAPADVLYGGELVVTAEITGGKLDAPVRCFTRDPATGKTEEAPAFQETPARFARKLEKVTEPVKVAFAVGRARSAWMPVSVRTQPKIQEVLVTIEPPAYSGMPRREFAAGTQELAALAGSRITARVTSNRPLTGGTLAIFPPGADRSAQDVDGEREDTHRVKFVWTTKNAARLGFGVRDVAGTESEPLEVEQKLLPDERPEVAMREPAGDILATPETELPLEATASDDFGLARVALVRKLVGYRERAETEAIQGGERRHEIKGKVNLASYGVLPGQTIELTIEARDTNPNLLGVSVSEPARIHIITREEYAQMLRNQTTLQEFADRYAALAEAMENARKALDELDAAAKSGDAAKAEEARRKAFEAHQNAAQTFAKIAKDFPIFDLDPALAQASADVARKLFENGKDLDDLANGSAKEMAEAVPELKKRLGESEKRVEQEMKKGGRAIAGARVIEQAGKFKQLIEEQRELVKDLNRVSEQIRRGETKAGPALRDIAKRQREIAGELRGVDKQLDEALAALPDEFARVKEQGAEFLKLLREREVPPLMDDAAKSADAADSRAAGEKSAEALARLEELLKKNNGMCKMCRGEGDEEFPWPEDLAQTMQQLMQSLIPRPGSGGSGNKPGGIGGSGQGAAGDSEHGFSMQGKMPRLPMYGPPRTSFKRNAGPQPGGSGKSGNGSRTGSPEGSADVPRDAVATQTARSGAGEGAATEAVPEAYRSAVKRFFSTEPNPNPSKP